MLLLPNPDDPRIGEMRSVLMSSVEAHTCSLEVRESFLSALEDKIPLLVAAQSELMGDNSVEAGSVLVDNTILVGLVISGAFVLPVIRPPDADGWRVHHSVIFDCPHFLCFETSAYGLQLAGVFHSDDLAGTLPASPWLRGEPHTTVECLEGEHLNASSSETKRTLLAELKTLWSKLELALELEQDVWAYAAKIASSRTLPLLKLKLAAFLQETELLELACGQMLETAALSWTERLSRSLSNVSSYVAQQGRLASEVGPLQIGALSLTPLGSELSRLTFLQPVHAPVHGSARSGSKTPQSFRRPNTLRLQREGMLADLLIRILRKANKAGYWIVALSSADPVELKAWQIFAVQDDTLSGVSLNPDELAPEPTLIGLVESGRIRIARKGPPAYTEDLLLQP